MRVAALMILASATACGSSAVVNDASTTDGATGDAGPPSVSVPAPPAPPESPRLTCPSGWHARVIAATSVCEPWTTGTPPDCPSGERAVLGASADCVPIADCPTADWPVAPSDAMYVRVGATGGDGSLARPFGTLAEAAFAAGHAGVPVVLGEGDYPAEVVILFDVPRVIGLCPARTTITQHDASGEAALVVSGSTPTSIEGVHVVGAHRAVSFHNDTTGTLDHAWLEARDNPLRVGSAAAVTVRASRIDGAEVNDPTNSDNGAVQLFPASSIDLHESLVVGGADGTSAFRGFGSAASRVTVEDSALLDVPAVGEFRLDVTMRRVAIERSGHLLVHLASTAVLEDVVIREARDTAILAVGATSLSRVLVDAPRSTSLMVGVDDGASGQPGSLDATDVVVAHSTVPLAVLAADFASTIHLARVALSDVQCGIVSTRSAMTIEDVSIDSLRSGPCGGAPVTPGVAASEGSIEVRRARLDAESGTTGLLIVGDATAVVEDFDTHGGQGIELNCELDVPCDDVARRTLARVRVRDVSRFGLSVLHSAVTLQDVDVRGVSPLESLRFAAVGVFTAFGGVVVGARVEVHSVTGIGILALRDATATLDDVTVEDVAFLRDCPSCGDAYGDAVVSAEGGRVALQGFDVGRAARAGVALAARCGTSRFARGIVHDSSIGVLTDGASGSCSSFDAVHVVDNRVSTDSANLAVPASQFGL